MAEEDSGEDFDSDLIDPRCTQWVILVNPQEDRWMVCRVSRSYEVGECEIDMSRTDSDWYVAAHFDQDVTDVTDALRLLVGNSIEGNSMIDGLLAGTCRAFVEARANLEKWKVKLPDVE